MTNNLTVCGRLVIPLMPVYMLIRHRRNLNAPKVQLQLGYIYRIYRYSQLPFRIANWQPLAPCVSAKKLHMLVEAVLALTRCMLVVYAVEKRRWPSIPLCKCCLVHVCLLHCLSNVTQADPYLLPQDAV